MYYSLPYISPAKYFDLYHSRANSTRIRVQAGRPDTATSMQQAPIVYLLHYYLSAGFGCEVLNLAYAIHYFQEHGLSYRIISATWIAAVDRGWHDYFVSLKEAHSVDSRSIRRLEKLLEVDRYLEKRMNKNIFYAIRNRTFPGIYGLISSNTCYYRGSELERIAREYCFAQRKENYEGFRHAISKILLDLWMPRRHLIARAATFLPGDRPFACIHIRRGDKVATGEDDYFPTEAYFQALKSAAPEIKVVYLMSDDNRVYEEACRAFPGYQIYQGPQHGQTGYDQAAYEAAPRSQVQQHTEDLIVDVDIARRAAVFVGTFKSNLFRLVEYLRDEPGIDISGRDRRHSSM